MADTKTPRVLVVEKGVQLTTDAYKKLNAAGFIVVRGDPKAFHVIDVLPAATEGAVLFAALRTIQEAKGYTDKSTVQNDFAKYLIGRLLAPAADTEGGPTT